MDKKSGIDRLFDFAEGIVDGASRALADVPEPDSDDEDTPKRVIDVPTDGKPLLKSGSEESMGSKKAPRVVVLKIRDVSGRRNGGVNIIAETPTHEVVCITLDKDDWKKICDSADWMRMVPE